MSSYSPNNGGSCVEAGAFDGRVAVRHSHHPDGPLSPSPSPPGRPSSAASRATTSTPVSS
ncbi:MAG: DUF397 domain-containing protein [Pseudonocardiaceae bacterium]